MLNTKTSILGDGGWGTTLSLLLHSKGLSASLWGAFPEYIEFLKKNRQNSKFLPGVNIPEPILFTSDTEEVLEGSAAVIIAIPSQFLRGVIKRFKSSNLFAGIKLVISAAKGIENKTFKRPSQIIEEELGLTRIVVLSGPTIAHEVADGQPASAVVASEEEEQAKMIRTCFWKPFRNNPPSCLQASLHHVYMFIFYYIFVGKARIFVFCGDLLLKRAYLLLNESF